MPCPHDFPPNRRETEVNTLHRRRRHVLVAALSIVVAPVGPVLAQPAIVPATLVGTWKTSAQHPTGAMTSVVRIEANGRFTTSSTLNGAPFLDASGRWQLAGRKLEWHYENASNPAIPKGYVDTDTVDSVGAKELTLTSVQSGRKHVYVRAD